MLLVAVEAREPEPLALAVVLLGATAQLTTLPLHQAQQILAQVAAVVGTQEAVMAVLAVLVAAA